MADSPYLFDLARPILAGASLAAQRRQSEIDALQLARQFRSEMALEQYRNQQLALREREVTSNIAEAERNALLKTAETDLSRERLRQSIEEFRWKRDVQFPLDEKKLESDIASGKAMAEFNRARASDIPLRTGLEREKLGISSSYLGIASDRLKIAQGLYQSQIEKIDAETQSLMSNLGRAEELHPFVIAQKQNEIDQVNRDARLKALDSSYAPVIREAMESYQRRAELSIGQGKGIPRFDEMEVLLQIDPSMISTPTYAQEWSRVQQQLQSTWSNMPDQLKVESAARMYEENAVGALFPQEAEAWRKKAEDIRATAKPKETVPADVRNFEFYQNLLKTDPEAAKKFLDFIDQGGMEVEQSPGGGLVVRTGKRGQAPVGIVTKATEGALGGLEVARKIDKVIGKITPGTVGLGANLGRLVDSTVIGDIFPEAVSRERVTVRQTLDMLSSDITRMMKSDSQIAEAERKLVERAIPRVKLAQSAEEARTQLFQIRGIIGKGKRSWLEAAQQTIPKEYWNEDEIAAEAKRKLAAGEPADAVTKWAQDMLYSSLYPNRFNQDMDKFLMYAPATAK